jgi:hypothetical protein
MRSCQLCSYSRTSQHFMGPGGSSPRSHELSTGPYPESDRSNPYHPSTSWSFQWSLSFWLSHQYPICIPPLPHSCCMPCCYYYYYYC